MSISQDHSQSVSNQTPLGLLLAICLPVMTACIDVMAVSVAFNVIMRDFSTSLDNTQWLLSGYTIGIAAFLITIGKIADIYGKRKLLLIGIFMFAFSSLTAAFSNSINLLILSRFIQGVASAVMMTTVMSLITSHFTPTERGPIIAKWASSNGLGLAIGPLVGAIIIYLINWRAIFAINIPICLLTFFLIIRYLPESKDEKDKTKIDWLETILLTALLISIVTILSVGDKFDWTSISIIMMSITSFIILTIFLIIEHSKKNPMIDFTLFKQSNFIGATICGFISYFFMYGWLFLFGIYLQYPYGLTSLQAGIVCVSFSIAFTFGAMIVGRSIDMLGNRTLIQIGFILSSIAFFCMTTITLNSPVWQLVCMFFLLGFAITIINVPSMAASTEDVPVNKAGIASGIIFTIRWLGGSIGVVVVTIIYRLVSHNSLVNFIHDTSMIPIKQKNTILTVLSNNHIESMKFTLYLSSNHFELLANQIKSSLTTGLSIVCTMLAILSIVGLACSTLLLYSRKKITEISTNENCLDTDH